MSRERVAVKGDAELNPGVWGDTSFLAPKVLEMPCGSKMVQLLARF
jgi:hypothetical protein